MSSLTLLPKMIQRPELGYIMSPCLRRKISDNTMKTMTLLPKSGNRKKQRHRRRLADNGMEDWS